MRLIITRPKADTEVLAAKLVARGHVVLAVPLLDIQPIEVAPFAATGLQAVCASSANAFNTTADLAPLLHLPFFAVGPQSAEAARAAGFHDVRIASGGNLGALVQLLASSLNPKAGRVLYLSGEEVSGDLAALLTSAGLSVERRIVYRAVPIKVTGLAEAAANADGVLLYSPRSARLWLKALADANVVPTQLRHFCLSANVASVLPQSVPISVAETSDEAGMLKLVDTHA